MSDPCIPGQPYGCEWMYDIFQEVPRASVQEPVGDIVEGASLWGSHIDEGQFLEHPPFDDSSLRDTPSLDQDHSSEFTSGATSYNPPPSDPTTFYAISTIQPGPFLAPENVEQALYQEPHLGPCDDAPYMEEVPFANSMTYSANASGSSSDAVASSSVDVLPFAPPSTAPLMAGPSAVSRSGSGYAAFNYRPGNGYRAPEPEFIPPSTEAEFPCALFPTPDGPSSTFTTPPSSGELLSSAGLSDCREYTTTTSPAEGSTIVQEIEQQPYKRYWMSKPARIDYGPNGISLSEALHWKPGRGGQRRLNRVAFDGVEMRQKMSLRFLFENHSNYKRQANILSARKNHRQPTYGRLAVCVAKEMERFMRQDKKFSSMYEWDRLVLLHIDLPSKGTLQPRIGVRSM